MNDNKPRSNADIMKAGQNFVGKTNNEKFLIPQDQNVNLAMPTQKIAKEDVTIDSGCSQHCFNDTRSFTFIQKLDDSSSMAKSNGGQLNIEGIGTVVIPIEAGIFTLENVFYCPQGAANMLSPGLLRRKGIVFDGINYFLVFKKRRRTRSDHEGPLEV